MKDLSFYTYSDDEELCKRYYPSFSIDKDNNLYASDMTEGCVEMSKDIEPHILKASRQGAFYPYMIERKIGESFYDQIATYAVEYSTK